MVRIYALFSLCLLVLPVDVDLSNPHEVPFRIFPNVWVSPFWYAHFIACGALFLIGGLRYDSFFASRHVSHGDSSTRRIRTSTNPAREHRVHAVTVGMYVAAAFYIAVEYVYFSGLLSPNLRDRHEAILEKNRQAQNQSLLADPRFQSLLAGFISYLMIRDGVDLYRIGIEARTDEMDDDSSIPPGNPAQPLRVFIPVETEDGESEDEDYEIRQILRTLESSDASS